MKKYIRINLVEAKRMSRGEYNKYRGWTIPSNEDPLDEGYLLKYKDGYESWCPKARFESNALEVGNNNSITQKLIDDYIENSCMDVQTVDIHTIDSQSVGKTTIVHVVLPNGFSIVESSSCVDPANYDEKIGEEICINKIKDKLWELFGFMLQTSLGIKEEI